MTTDGTIVQGKDTTAGGGMTTNVDLSKILLSEVVTGEAGKLGAEYKLTLLAGKNDYDRENIKIEPDTTDIKRTEDEVTVSYTLRNTNWTTYRINQVSVLFFDKPYGDSDAKLLAYEKIEGQQIFQ